MIFRIRAVVAVVVAVKASGEQELHLQPTGFIPTAPHDVTVAALREGLVIKTGLVVGRDGRSGRGQSIRPQRPNQRRMLRFQTRPPEAVAAACCGLGPARR